jgi:hypothetical protein
MRLVDAVFAHLLTGTPLPIQASLAALRAQQINAKRADELAARVAQLEAAQAAAAEQADAQARAAALMVGRDKGKITPADEADPDWRATVAAIPTALLPGFIEKLAVRAPTEARVPAGHAAATPQALTEEEREFARRAGLTPEEFLAQKRADAAAQKGSL